MAGNRQSSRSVVLLHNPPRGTNMKHYSKRTRRHNPPTPIDQGPLTPRVGKGAANMVLGAAAAVVAVYGVNKIPGVTAGLQSELVTAATGVVGAVALHAAKMDRAGLAFGGAALGLAGASAGARAMAAYNAPATTPSTPPAGFAGADSQAYQYNSVWGGR